MPKDNGLRGQVLTEYYKSLLETQSCSRISVENEKSQMVFGGTNPVLQQQCLHTVGLKECTLPMKYLGVPIIASKLTKIECTILVDKITAKIHTWATRHISYAGRLILINNASIFILPTEVIEKLTKVCRNFLWNGTEEFQGPPHISWNQSCLPKNKGGLGLIDFAAWNKNTIAKLRKKMSYGCVGSMGDIYEEGTGRNTTLLLIAVGTRRNYVRFSSQIDAHCILCQQEEEDDQHLFFDCPFAQSIWKDIHLWWPIPMSAPTMEGRINSLLRLKGDNQSKNITYAICSAVIYNIWTARNFSIF
ncbi:hypothetical protein Cgig2_010685 [Carnegiea gigantea]|uniref:Reverse transcriptase zinc-binding domain-containing protein n=1 Tax=Carnegiea gigantea TaxID=171969 RepID=A0A9Q1KL94_9CARY|nr:hypothetical protein Cgig2_010685 [Carnegiea gigantea]